MSTDSRPNVLFVFSDQQRGDWVGTTPDVPVQTPNYDRLAERGVEFTDAICPSPVCAPSRSCLALGQEYDRCGVPANASNFPTDRRSETHFNRLREEAGYHVVGVGKMHLGRHHWGAVEGSWDATGRNLLEEWGFSDGRFNAGMNQAVGVATRDPLDSADPYATYLREEGLLQMHADDYERRNQEGRWTATFPTPLPQEAYFDDWITRGALDFVDDLPQDDPWFLQVNLQNPHHPWDITEDMHGWYRDPDVTFPDAEHCDLDVSAETHQEIRRNYSAEVEHLDRCLGRLIDRVAERGELDETVIVYASDHGEMLGDHGQWQKMSPLQASIGVPLVVAGPGVADRDPYDGPATTMDLHATFLELAGLDPAPHVDSRSMVPLFRGDVDEHREVVTSGLSSWRLAYDGQHKLIEGYDPSLRFSDEFEPMAVARDEVERRRAEREAILHDLEHNEVDNHASDRPDVVERLHESIESAVEPLER
jgi:arylsulfatase A-like enzyme